MLEALQDNGRIRDAELAKRLALSPSACRRHRERLERRGAITGYAATVDERRLGYGECVFVEVTLTSQQHEDMEAFWNAVQNVEAVTECYEVSGTPDFILRVVAQDADHYHKILFEELSRLHAVDHVKSHFTLRTMPKKAAPVPRSHWK